MFSLNFLKKSGPESQPNRCHFQHQNGRRCRLPVAGESTEFCGTHRDMLAQAKTHEDHEADLAAIYAEVMGPVQSLDSAVAINHVLGNLFRLTLLGRIPQRKAATLTTQLRALLRSAEAAKHEIVTAKLFPQNNADLLNLLSLLNGDDAESETVAPHSGLHRDREGGRTCAAAFSAHNSVSHSEPAHTIVAAGLDRPGSGQSRDIKDPAEFGSAIDHKTVAPHSTAAAPRVQDSSTQPESRPAVVAAAFTPPGSRQAVSHEESPDFSSATGHQNVAPHSGAAASPASIPTSATTNSDELDLDPHDEILNATEPAVSSTSIPPQTQSTTSTYDYSDGVCWIGPKPDQIDWARLEQEKQDYERYLRETYPVTFDGIHLVPPDKQPLWWKLKKRR